MRDFKTLGLAFVLLPALAAGSDAAKSGPSQGDAASCAALAGKTVAPNTTIESAEYLPDGGTWGTAKLTVPFCRVVGVASPTSDSHVGFEVWLPPTAEWNGKFQGEGSGGSAGSISAGAMAEA